MLPTDASLDVDRDALFSRFVDDRAGAGLVACRTAACPDSVWLPPCAGAKKPASHAKAATPAAPAPAARPAPPPAPACPDGKSITDDTAGHCCWSGQVLVERPLHRRPHRLPEGMAPDAQRERCAPAPCKDGQARTRDLHCCSARPGLVAHPRHVRRHPRSLPSGFKLSVEQQQCVAPTPCPLGRVRMADAVHCCWPGQRLAGDRCAGSPQCPPDFIANPYADSCELPDCLPGLSRVDRRPLLLARPVLERPLLRHAEVSRRHRPAQR